jgi:putative aldouronate transport system substrate-binding protein
VAGGKQGIERQYESAGLLPTRLGTIMAGNDLPDMLYVTTATGFATKGVVQFLEASYADLTPYLSGDADYPNLAAFPPTAWKQTILAGAIRGVPVSRPCLQAVWFVNQTQFDAVGAPHPTNADDFKRILLDFTSPQQNRWRMGAQGPAYGVIYNGYGDCPQAAMFGVPNNWAVDGNGTFTKDFETEQFKATLAYVRGSLHVGRALSGSYADGDDAQAWLRRGQVRRDVSGVGSVSR